MRGVRIPQLLVLCLLSGSAQARGSGPATRPGERSSARSSASSARASQPALAPRPAARTLSGQAKELGLLPRADGGYSYDGGDQERFRAHISPAGTVHFWTEPRFTIKVQRNCAMAVCPNRAAARSAITPDQRRKERRRKRASFVVSRVLTSIVAAAAQSYSSSATMQPPRRNSPLVGAMGQPGFAGAGAQVPGPIPHPTAPLSPGAVAPYRLAFGYLPPPTREQQAFLDRTLKFRLQLAVAHRRRLFDQAIISLMDELSKLESSSLATTQKKAKLLSLWTSVDWSAPHTTSQPSPDAKLAKGVAAQLDQSRARKARLARTQILGTACRLFDPKGPHAFTPAELADFEEQGGSDLPFEPSSRKCSKLSR